MPANRADLQQLQAALQLSPPPKLPEFVPEIFISADAHRSGIIRPRLRSIVVTASTGALAAASMTGTLRVTPAPGFAWRLLRASAYVRNTTAGAQPREPTMRNLTYADLRTRGRLTPPLANMVAVDGSGALLVDEELAGAATVSDAGGIALAASRISDDFDQLVTWTGAARGTWAGEVYLAGYRTPNAGQSAVEFYWRRTPGAGDLDTAVLALTYVATHEGMIP